MPILFERLADPTDLVLQGEQMRVSVLDQPVTDLDNIMNGSIMVGFSSLVPDDDAWLPMNSFIDLSRLTIRRSKDGILQRRANAGIATPCGAWITNDYGGSMNPLLWATERWAISGVTKDSTGAALAGCRVIGNETGRLALDGIEAEVGETLSDGAGNYTLTVPTNTAYQLTSYKAGSPDVAGITANTVTPVAIG